MRLLAILIPLSMLALAACADEATEEAPAEVDRALESSDLSGNDITAIDAAFAADAGMVGDMDPDAEVPNLEFQTEIAPPRAQEDDERPSRPARSSQATAEEPAEPAATQSSAPPPPQDELAPRPDGNSTGN